MFSHKSAAQVIKEITANTTGFPPVNARTKTNHSNNMMRPKPDYICYTSYMSCHMVLTYGVISSQSMIRQLLSDEDFAYTDYSSREVSDIPPLQTTLIIAANSDNIEVDMKTELYSKHLLVIRILCSH